MIQSFAIGKKKVSLPSRRRFRKAAILGLGLMGGSLGLAIRRRKLADRVVGYARRVRTRRQALDRGAVDQAVADPLAAVRGADLVVFCLPVSLIPRLAKACAPVLAAGAVVTDVGSSKREIVARLETLVRSVGARFVGSHPIAGSERQGLGAASARLYANAVVVLTPTSRTDRAALRQLKAFWAGLGAWVAVLSPEAHDQLLARTSHLPHLVAALLSATVGRRRPTRLAQFCGHGFADSTRIAEGAPDLWLDIIASNRRAILGELRAFQAGLTRLITSIERRDFAAVKRFLERGRSRRRRLVKP